MKFILLFLLTFSSLFAKLSVAVAYPYIAELTQSIAKNKVKVKSLSKANWDPHFVVPKPSLIYLKLSEYIKLQDIPRSTSRSILDPHNLIKLAKIIYFKLALLDSKNKDFYKKNFLAFKKHWQKKISSYDRKMKKCPNIKVIQYHELFNYFLRRYNIQSIDNIEPLPGLKPNPRHTLKLINEIKENRVKFILQDVYHEHKTAKFISKKTGVKVLELPHDVYAIRSIKSLDSFYDYLVKSLCK